VVGPFRPLVLSLLSLISRNSPKQLGMVSPELPRALDPGGLVEEPPPLVSPDRGQLGAPAWSRS